MEEDDLFNFESEDGQDDEEEAAEDEEDETDHPLTERDVALNHTSRTMSSFTPTALGSALLTVMHHPDGPFVPFDDIEEELEWISNKDAFPDVETFPEFLANRENPSLPKQSSPVSVLSSSSSSASSTTTAKSSTEGVTMGHTKRPRSKRVTSRQVQCSWFKFPMASAKQTQVRGPRALGRKCQHCGVEKTPQWRAGPLGAKTLCNACGVRYKSGRLVPEYRPANSPTFCSDLHSNSHRKVVEMRRMKHVMGLPVTRPTVKDVG